MNPLKTCLRTPLLSHRKLEQAKGCPATKPGWRAAFLFAESCTTHGVKLGCDSSENGFPEKNDGHGHDRLFLFLVPNPSAVRRLSTALACMDPSERKNAGPRSPAPALARRVQAIKTVQAKKKKKKTPWPYNALETSTLNMQRHQARMKNSEQQKSLPTNPHTNMHTAEFSADFLPTILIMADIKFRAEVSARGLYCARGRVCKVLKRKRDRDRERERERKRERERERERGREKEKDRERENGGDVTIAALK